MLLDFTTLRNPSAESPGVSVAITAERCQIAGIGASYAGLCGVVTQVSSEDAECLVHLSKESHKRYTDIEGKAFSEPLRDLSEEQWFASGLLEVVQESEQIA